MTPNADSGAVIKYETVNMGYCLADCSECGTIGVWPKRWAAKAGGEQHLALAHNGRSET